MVELGTGTLSVCLPTMRPLFSHLRSSSGSVQMIDATADEELGSQGQITQPLTPTMATITNIQRPSQSVDFAHLGVLGVDLEQLFVDTPVEEKQKAELR